MRKIYLSTMIFSGNLGLETIGAGRTASCCKSVPFCILSSGSPISKEACYSFLFILTCFVVFCSAEIIKKEVSQIQKNITQIFNDLSSSAPHCICS